MQSLARFCPSLAGSLLLVASGCVLAQPSTAVPPSPPSPPAQRTVYLNSPAAVENLKTEDPRHYAQVKAILAAADVICAPGPGSIQQASHNARCEGLFLRTSNPPKRQISFTLDDTHYIALVVLTHLQVAPVPAQR